MITFRGNWDGKSSHPMDMRSCIDFKKDRPDKSINSFRGIFTQLHQVNGNGYLHM